jgi:hypothetical protein
VPESAVTLVMPMAAVAISWQAVAIVCNLPLQEDPLLLNCLNAALQVSSPLVDCRMSGILKTKTRNLINPVYLTG